MVDTQIVGTDALEEYLFNLGVPHTELIQVDRKLQGIKVSQEVFKALGRLLYLPNVSTRMPSSDRMDMFLTLRNKTRFRRRAHATRMLQAHVALRGVAALRRSDSLVPHILSFLQPLQQETVGISRAFCVGHGCRFECKGVLAFIAHVQDAHLPG